MRTMTPSNAITLLVCIPFLQLAKGHQHGVNGGVRHLIGENEIANNDYSEMLEDLGIAPSSKARHLHEKGMGCGTLTGLPSFGPSDPIETVTSFYVMGDVPYELDERYCLNQQLRDLDLTTPGGPSFIVHVGDIKKSGKCNVEAYNDVAEIFTDPSNADKYDRQDVFFLPGDNEWIDCYNEDEAWNLWTQHFGHNNPYGFGTFSSGNVTVERQLGVERRAGVDRSENLAFFKDDTLFIAVNLIGGEETVGGSLRLQQNIDWIREKLEFYANDMVAFVLFGHAGLGKERAQDFGIPLKSLLRTEYNGLPTIYIHGDWHKFCANYVEYDLNPHFIDVQVEKGREAPPLMVSLLRNTNDGTLLFDIDERGGSYPLDTGCPKVEEQTWNEPILVPLPTTPLMKVKWNPPFPDGTTQLGLCQGDCDGDSECRDGLMCFDRKLNETVPGCTGYGTDQMDYCIQATPVPTPSPTPSPTPIPLSSPTPPTPCRDDPKWNYLDKRGRIKYCSWVGRSELRLDARCRKIGIDGTPASEACQRTCGLCPE